MINNIIKEQLKKCKIASIPSDLDTLSTITIRKYKELVVSQDECFLIKLDDSLMIKNNNIFMSNWNKNIIPIYKYLKIDVVKTLNKMILVNSIGYDYENKKDLNYTWTGWLPLNCITIIEKI